jgi:hypothetical protein
MTTVRAQQIQRIGPYLFADDIIVAGESIEKQEWSKFVFWLDLENMGIINKNLVKTINSSRSDCFENAFVYGDKVLICKGDINNKKIKLKVHRVTRLGVEVLSLGKFTPDYEYLMSIAQDIKQQDLKVYIGNLVAKLPGGKVRSENITEIA